MAAAVAPEVLPVIVVMEAKVEAALSIPLPALPATQVEKYLEEQVNNGEELPGGWRTPG
jgi:hypothetical protein